MRCFVQVELINELNNLLITRTIVDENVVTVTCQSGNDFTQKSAQVVSVSCKNATRFVIEIMTI